MYAVFIDREKAFYRVDWKKLMEILKKIGVNWKGRRLLSNLYMKERIKVRIGEQLSEGSEIGMGYAKDALYRLHHGCVNHATEGETLQSPIHCCDVTNPPYLFSGELCTSTLHCERLFVYPVCCRRGGQCFSVLRTRNSDAILT